MECKLTAHDSQKSGQRLDQDKRFLSLLCLGADVGGATPSPPSLLVLFTDRFHTSIPHEAPHRCLSPLVPLNHRGAVGSTTRAARKRLVEPRPNSALQLFSWSFLTRSALTALTSFLRKWHSWRMEIRKHQKISDYWLRQTDLFSCFVFKLLKSHISHQKAPAGLLHPYQVCSQGWWTDWNISSQKKTSSAVLCGTKRQKLSSQRSGLAPSKPVTIKRGACWFSTAAEAQQQRSPGSSFKVCCECCDPAAEEPHPALWSLRDSLTSCSLWRFLLCFILKSSVVLPQCCLCNPLTIHPVWVSDVSLYLSGCFFFKPRKSFLLQKG